MDGLNTTDLPANVGERESVKLAAFPARVATRSDNAHYSFSPDTTFWLLCIFAEIVVFPTALHLREVQSVLRREVTVGAQNCYHTDGAFTGEISVRMLVDAGISTTLLGHSERRHVFGESNSLLTTKTKAVQEARVGLVACVGELLEDRDANRTMDVVTEQLQAFAGVYRPPFLAALCSLSATS